MTLNAAKIVSSAVVGLDFKTVVVHDRPYVIFPPTIHKIAGATYWLSDFGEADTLRELLMSLKDLEHLAKALSWFIQGDDALAEELAQGTLSEVVEALDAAFSLIDTANFLRLSVLARSAKNLTAKQRS